MVKQNKIVQDKQDIKTSKKDYVFAVGRRKESVARVRLYKIDTVTWDGITVDKGKIFVNKKPAEVYFGSLAVKVYTQPLIVTGTDKRFVITVKVEGGGKAGQIDSTTLGIARALDKFDKEKFHAVLRKKGLLTRDPRARERRKVGMGGKARRKKQSPKR